VHIRHLLPETMG